MKYKALLFDLDGTLTASGEGITKSVQYALKKMRKGKLASNLKELEVFVGPPLLNQFMIFAGFSEEEAALAVKYYRERYTVTGIFENKPYEGITSLLRQLKEKGYLLAVASSKPDSMVKVVLEHFHLQNYFHVVKGSDINRPTMTKAQVIEEVLEELALSDRTEAVMIGDRFYDVRGAREAGLSCIGVAYGYGSREELEQEGAVAVAETVAELGSLFGFSEKKEQDFQIYDIGKELFSSPVYPGDPKPEKSTFLAIEKGDICNLTIIKMGSHNGTHLDAPKHFCQGKGGVDTIPLEKCVGYCKVVEISGVITGKDMERFLADGTKKLLLKGEILLTPEAARVIADAKIDLIGVESQTVGESHTQPVIHEILLSVEVVILEGLVLKQVKPGQYFLAAQPLKWEGLDGSPVRPVLISAD